MRLHELLFLTRLFAILLAGPFNFESPTDFSVDAIVAAAKRFAKKRALESDEENQENVANAASTSKRGKSKKRRSAD